ncbi:MAG: hypothetical protein IPJ24_03625 [bacterium]|nr:hypothetical protein [bacterium]
MRSATTALMIAAMLALVPATTALAHGVRTEVAVGAMTVATFTHEDGSPMAGVPFTVTTPAGDRGLPHRQYRCAWPRGLPA